MPEHLWAARRGRKPAPRAAGMRRPDPKARRPGRRAPAAAAQPSRTAVPEAETISMLPSLPMTS
jgi:hypothetical protein